MTLRLQSQHTKDVRIENNGEEPSDNNTAGGTRDSDNNFNNVSEGMSNHLMLASKRNLPS